MRSQTSSPQEVKSASDASTSHSALYRKYRPQEFSDVVGQDHIVSVLEGSIKSGTITHAYLFSGSRGTGKTSIARIFARALGCSPNDLYEIDAASNRGIDDIRELRESVGTMPFESPYKVYIIDEVHMLTKEAFNALLKTLEEPPKHALFILATTETDKLPETVVSRCQTFTFKKPSQKILSDVVMEVSKEEGVSLEAGAAGLIALLGDGSFRDTLGILQKVMSASGGNGGASPASKGKEKKISLEEVEKVTGAPRSTLINDFVKALAESDVEMARQASLAALNSALESNIDIKIFIRLALEKLRSVLLLKSARATFEPLFRRDLSEHDFSFIDGLARKPESRITHATLAILLRAYDETGHAAIAELPLQIALVKAFAAPVA